MARYHHVAMMRQPNNPPPPSPLRVVFNIAAWDTDIVRHRCCRSFVMDTQPPPYFTQGLYCAYACFQSPPSRSKAPHPRPSFSHHYPNSRPSFTACVCRHRVFRRACDQKYGSKELSVDQTERESQILRLGWMCHGLNKRKMPYF